MDESGKTLYENSIQLRIHGLGTRALSQKSLRILPDDMRGDSLIHYRFFENLPYDSFHKILLKCFGDNVEWAHDVMLQQMVKELWHEIQEYALAVVYVNGNYWGIHYFREKPDENYLAAKYDASLDSIVILNYYRNLELQYGDAQLLTDFEELIDFIKHNSMTDDNAYQYVCSRMDVNNFIDYIIIETFFANYDWGYSNIRLYRIDQQTAAMSEKNIEAGKWRFLLFDLDAGMEKSPSYNIFDILKERFAGDFITPMFYGLLENPEFKEQFLMRYQYVIHHYLTTEKMLQQIEFFESQHQPEIERHIARWRDIESMKSRQESIERMKDFAKKRHEIVLEQLKAL
jgi:hypothetical protein